MEKKTLEEKTTAAIATLELGMVDQTTRGDIIDVLKEWLARDESLREKANHGEAATPAT